MNKNLLIGIVLLGLVSPLVLSEQFVPLELNQIQKNVVMTQTLDNNNQENNYFEDGYQFNPTEGEFSCCTSNFPCCCWKPRAITEKVNFYYDINEIFETSVNPVKNGTKIIMVPDSGNYYANLNLTEVIMQYRCPGDSRFCYFYINGNLCYTIDTAVTGPVEYGFFDITECKNYFNQGFNYFSYRATGSFSGLIGIYLEGEVTHYV